MPTSAGPIEGCAAPRDDKPVIETESTWIPHGFPTARSKHFLLAHDSDASTARERLDWMEATYECVISFLRDSELPVSLPTNPLQAIASRDGSARALTNVGRIKRVTMRSGYYDHSSKRSYFGLPPTADPDDYRTEMLATAARLTVHHETVHQVLDAACPELFSQLPPLISEGLACLFECPAADRRACDRCTNPWRAADLLESLNYTAAAEPHSDAATSLLRLLMNDRLAEAADGELSPAAYSRAWGLVSYLAKERRPDFDAFLRALTAPADAHRLDPYSAFRSIIGPLDRALAENVLTHVRASIAPPEQP